MHKLKTLICIIAVLAAAIGLVTLADAANDTASPLWVIDTTGALTTNNVRVVMVCWMDCAANGDDFVLQDSSGKNVLKDSDGEAGTPHLYYLDIPCTGLVLDTLDSGYLQILVRERNY